MIDMALMMDELLQKIVSLGVTNHSGRYGDFLSGSKPALAGNTPHS